MSLAAERERRRVPDSERPVEKPICPRRGAMRMDRGVTLLCVQTDDIQHDRLARELRDEPRSFSERGQKRLRQSADIAVELPELHRIGAGELEDGAD